MERQSIERVFPDPEGVEYSTLSGSERDFAWALSMGFTHGH
jgi:hypothetical protein